MHGRHSKVNFVSCVEKRFVCHKKRIKMCPIFFFTKWEGRRQTYELPYLFKGVNQRFFLNNDFFLQKKSHQIWAHHMTKYYKASSTRSPPKIRGKGGLDIKNLDFFPLVMIKKCSLAIKICPLVWNGAFSVIASFEEIWSSKWFLIHFYLVYTFLVLPPTIRCDFIT